MASQVRLYIFLTVEEETSAIPQLDVDGRIINQEVICYPAEDAVHAAEAYDAAVDATN